jgi:hypothetical protein
MKKKPALIAALLTTMVVALAMLMIGVSAYANPEGVPISTSAESTTNSADAALSSGAAADQIAQLQTLVAQYQSREEQYQTQLTQANSQLEQYQGVLSQLQRLRLITIDRNGQITVARRGN